MSDHAPRILIVDDGESVRKLLAPLVRHDGFETVGASGETEAVERFGEAPFDLVVIDPLAPGLDGPALCRRLRSAGPVAILALGAGAGEDEVVATLDAGADEFVSTPLSARELRSRIGALLRRPRAAGAQGGPGAGVIEHGEMRIDPLRRAVTVGGRPAQLTFAEFELLLAMASSPGRVWARDQLLGQVWGASDYRDPRTVDVHIRNLREKVEPEPASPEYVQTVRGVGYRFREDAA